MPRSPRIDYMGARHHAMNRGARKAKIFFDDRCCDRFIELLGELPERFGMAIHGYCLMPNHFHLLLESRSARLSDALGYLQRSYSAWLNRRYEWDGPLLRGRFRNRVVVDEDYWRHLLAYIHLNPVRAGLARTPDEVKWSSHAAYVGLAPRPDWLTVDEMLDLYGSLSAYRQYLVDLIELQETPPEGFDPAMLWKGPMSGIMPAHLQARVAEASLVPAWTEMNADQRIDTAIVELVHVTGLSRDELLSSPRGRTGNPTRWVTAWWLGWSGRVPGVRIARLMGISAPGVSQMVAKVRQRRDTDQLLDHWMTKLEGIYQGQPTGQRKA